MAKNIIYPYFTIEIPEGISGEDLRTLRKLYTPLLNPDAIILYEYLRDLAINTNEGVGFFDYDSLARWLCISVERLNQAREKLESVCLISTFIDKQNRKTVFHIARPLSNLAFKKNIMLSNHLLSQVGLADFQRFLNLHEQKRNSKTQYLEETSAKYQDVFEEFMPDFSQNGLSELKQALKKPSRNITIENEQSKKQETLFETFDYKNPYEAILKTEAKKFYSQISALLITNEVDEAIANARFNAFDDASINLISFYVSEISKSKGKFSSKYFVSILNDLVNKEINSFDALEEYLDRVWKNKYQVSISKKELYKSAYLESLNNPEETQYI
ncbi:replication initiation and membrane attachment family protein [Mycoplasmopsis gallinarum]|uniref:hypothetical protein n=1 Tax=Mycoplasmopsis gallinarum TaxID=29557 RepID=UPI000484A35F|nr:hypothetical protein [Mycoplasmopsis gallinarum]